MSNERKAVTLGMPHGTATNKLRKNIMFFLLCRLGENDCYRCKKKIDTVDELSIEHIKPWEGISAELFWDLQNVSFSHLRCNRPHTNNGGSPRFKGLEGTAWCSNCKKFEPVENFYKNVSHWNGLSFHCKKSRPDRISVAMSSSSV